MLVYKSNKYTTNHLRKRLDQVVSSVHKHFFMIITLVFDGYTCSHKIATVCVITF